MSGSDTTPFETDGLFDQADIQVDAILSHPWLVEKKLGAIPNLKALTALEPELALLRGSILDPPTPSDQEADSIFWVDQVFAAQVADHQEWFTLNMCLPPMTCPSRQGRGRTPPP